MVARYPLLTIIPVRSQSGRCHLPTLYLYLYIYPCIYTHSICLLDARLGISGVCVKMGYPTFQRFIIVSPAKLHILKYTVYLIFGQTDKPHFESKPMQSPRTELEILIHCGSLLHALAYVAR